MKKLDKINSPVDLKKVSAAEIPDLCDEIRRFLINNVSKTGGHFASNLGAVELTVAIDRVYDPEIDRIIFDVGHQAYVHKLLTGRRDDFSGLRQYRGMSGFPKPSESRCDAFITGHASTSISAALGMARARTLCGEDYHICAVIGDGSMTGGLAYEAIADAGQSGEPMVVILNDNAMSISQSVGGTANMLSHMRTRPAYFAFKRFYHRTVGRVRPVYLALHRVKEWLKSYLLPENLFSDMGFYYLGPINGHDEQSLEQALRYARDMNRPVLLHVLTLKGKGYAFAEQKPELYHGVSAFDPAVGIQDGEKRDFSAVFGETMCRLAEENNRVVAITAAMLEGTGLKHYSEQHPKRFFDVGICEEHAVTMASGMAAQGLKPVLAVYSSFLQRGYDMLIHDVSLSKQHVVFGVDRAGLVGADGETHHGVFDVSFLRSVPYMKILSPANFAELQAMLRSAVLEMDGPVAVRYPRGVEGEYTQCNTDDEVLLYSGDALTIVSYGVMINEALAAARVLEEHGICCDVIKLSRLDNIPLPVVTESLRKTGRLLVAEEVCSAGCIGEHILTVCQAEKIELKDAVLLNLGEGIVPHGKVEELRALYALDSDGIAYAAMSILGKVEQQMNEAKE